MYFIIAIWAASGGLRFDQVRDIHLAGSMLMLLAC